MNNCAIICEYNPFHTGHAYQLNCVRERGASAVICVMSGNFVQSAYPAFCDKSIRAECAVRGGASAVIELPSLYATASAGYFAEGAIKIISAIGGITHIAMGATSPSDIVFRLADIKLKRKTDFDAIVKSGLKNGKSYNYACTEAFSALYRRFYDESADVSTVINEPNNMLCIEYISAIDKLNANVEPLIIMREGGKHNSTESNGDYISATAIRTAFTDNNEKSVERYIPFAYKHITEFCKAHAPDIEAYKKAAFFAIKCADENTIAELRNCADGMEHAVKNAKFSSYEELVNAESLKKFGRKKIVRLLLDCLLAIKKSFFSYPFVTRLLACAKDFDFKLLPDFVKTVNADIKALAKTDSKIGEALGVDERATALYGTLCGIADGYYNYSLVKV